VINQAILLAQAHALRGYDAVQLAAAVTVKTRLFSIRLPPTILVSADNALNIAAANEGLSVEDPNSFR
jgi:hypothetical protein